ncbi:uncharacterized protein [Epargyreus clarus]|uniref:uncharacterized protein n=1 Tax=Epargyreus clarus TaxID=520877 RepID=UPI003C2B39C8
MRRTPRRRISPRTKLRCRAIKNFLRRALGSASQPDLQINSTLSASVTDLKHKIVGIEQQLNKVSKHCQDLACLEYNLKANTISSVTTEAPNNVEPTTTEATKSIKQVETKVLYNPSQERYDSPTYRESTSKVIHCNKGDENKVTSLMSDQNYLYNYKEKSRSKHDRLDPIQESEQNLRTRKNYSALDKFPTTCPMNSLNLVNKPEINSREQQYTIYRQKKRNRKGHVEISNRLTKENHLPLIEQRCGDQRKHHTNKYESTELDQDFIADIIRRQYRPVKLLGRRESDFSQFSAPVCRDQELSVHDSLLEGSDLCSCCHREHRHHRHSRYMCSNDLSDIRSICDTRLYSSRKHKHHTNRRKHLEDYNDSAMYDIVPVKEKTSPKSRRKFVDDNISMYDKYKEVPPSPRTLRPRLNLQAQFHTDEDDELPLTNKQLRQRIKCKPQMKDDDNSNMSSEVFIHNRNKRRVQKSQIANTPKPYSQGVGTLSSLQYPIYVHEPATLNNDTTLNTQTTDMSGDKTDKTLSEIKDILQSFLLEIKKESSQSDKLNNQPDSQKVADPQVKTKNVTASSGESFNNNNSFAQCSSFPPFMQPFTNPCCYPILPLCPMNCMRNGFVVPSPSFTCATCANNSKEQTCGTNDFKNKTNCPETTNSETQKLIKEIHKFISQNPNTINKNRSHDINSKVTNNHYSEKNTLTSRSVGDSTKASKHDAKVGTPKMKYYSKSCEAIGSREAANTQYVANGSYSDTILEKGSGEETTTAQSSSETESSSESTSIDKKKGGKFSKMLRSIGLLKGKKNDVIKEIDESDSSLEVNKTKWRPPFQQNIMNYNMHRQEYVHPPPMPTYPHHVAHNHQSEYCNHPVYHDPRNCFSATPRQNKMKDSTGRNSHEHDVRMHYKSPHHMQMPPYANYYDSHYGNVSPQVPLCLKEIEVKSIGTQSVRKMSFLQKFTNKIPAPSSPMKELSQKQSLTQTDKDRPGKKMFDWKKLQAKAMQSNSDPINFSYKTQKRLAEGDNKMRKAMLKKLFYKRNPFSPRNLLIRTLLGKDRSSFGEPPKMYKPSMFL